MGLSERIREAIDGSGKSAATIAREVKKSESAVSLWMSGGIKTLRADSAAALEAATGYSAAWIVTGRLPKQPGNVEPFATRDVPVISWVQAGAWSEIADNFQPGDADEWLPCPVKHGPRTYALLVRGLSMFNPGGLLSFKEGDKIFVDPDREAINRSLVVARLDDKQEATFKQLLIEGDQHLLLALNPSWPGRILSVDGNFTLCGVVVGKLESFV